MVNGVKFDGKILGNPLGTWTMRLTQSGGIAFHESVVGFSLIAQFDISCRTIYSKNRRASRFLVAAMWHP